MGDVRISTTISPLTSDWNTDRYSGKGRPQFLDSVTIAGLRGWAGETVEFRFPVRHSTPERNVASWQNCSPWRAVREFSSSLSTHSPYVLEQLPTEARAYIQLERGGTRDVIYGVTPDFAMSLMDDVDHAELTLYCEDREAVVMIDALLSIDTPTSGDGFPSPL
ncbi:hypothetical protein [Streptomyces sp. NPDC002587]